MKFTWMIKEITEKIKIGENEKPKISILVEEVNDNEYKTSIAFDFIWEEKVAMIEDAKVWDVVAVSYNIRANKHEDKLYNSINWWKIDNMSQPKQSWPQSADPTKDDYEEQNFGE